MEPIDLKKFLKNLELEYIQKALEFTKTKADAARLLGLNRTTLLERMRCHKLPLNEPPAKKPKLSETGEVVTQDEIHNPCGAV